MATASYTTSRDVTTTDDYTFVRVTRTYIIDTSQAKQAVAVARALSAQTKYYSHDTNGKELVVEGKDYLNKDGSPDVVAAMNDLPDPELLLQIECIESAATALSHFQVAAITDRWPENWRKRRGTQED